MKRLILVLFIIFGTLSFSSLDKIIVGVVNDNYENPIISGTINRGGLANLLFGMKKDGDFAKQMYKNLSGANKVEFICGHPDWCCRIEEWAVEPHVQALDQSGVYIGACAVQGRKIYAHKVTKEAAVLVKTAT